MDSDEDDMVGLTIMAIQQALFNTVEVVGIVIEDGYLSIDQGTRLVYYWTQRLFPELNIPIIKGYPREAYLAETRQFPGPWVAPYLKLLAEKYPDYETIEPVFQTPEEFMARYLTTTTTSGTTTSQGSPLHIVSVGPTTSLPLMVAKSTQFADSISDVILGLGDVSPHYIYPGKEEEKKPLPPLLMLDSLVDCYLKAIVKLYAMPEPHGPSMSLSSCKGLDYVSIYLIILIIIWSLSLCCIYLSRNQGLPLRTLKLIPHGMPS